MSPKLSSSSTPARSRPLALARSAAVRLAPDNRPGARQPAVERVEVRDGVCRRGGGRPDVPVVAEAAFGPRNRWGDAGLGRRARRALDPGPARDRPRDSGTRLARADAAAPGFACPRRRRPRPHPARGVTASAYRERGRLAPLLFSPRPRGSVRRFAGCSDPPADRAKHAASCAGTLLSDVCGSYRSSRADEHRLWLRLGRPLRRRVAHLEQRRGGRPGPPCRSRGDP